jgi:hypothetical protein
MQALDAAIAAKWQGLLTRPWALEFLSSLTSADRRVFGVYMTQVFHYTSHTARNQALVGSTLAHGDVHYMKYCFKHALEEAGHELMALHDLKAVGAPIETAADLPPPLPATELMVAYLYWVSTQGNPFQRLGFSYWAEQSYRFIGNQVDGSRERMGLREDQMTFFYNHAHIDETHAEEVKEILLKVCKTDDDWAAVTRVAEITLDLSGQMLEQVRDVHAKMIAGEPTAYDLYQCLAPEPQGVGA